MGKTREIKGRIKAVGNIQRITKTMQMIATSKFAKAQASATAAKPFTEGVFQLVQELAATGGEDIDHPLISGPSAGSAKRDEVWLVLTSDRGLCGAYNSNVLRRAIKGVRESSAPTQVEVAGKKGVNYFRFAGVPISVHYSHFGDTPRREDVDALAEDYMNRFVTGQAAAVRVAYMRFISAGKQEPEILQLLPLKPPAAEEAQEKKTGAVYEFSPPADELLGELLPVVVKATLNQCFQDAVVSEHVARMVAMKAATDNATKMGKLLTRQFNRARQAQITTELTEIISGAQALE